MSIEREAGSLRILVIDDDEDDYFIVKELLQEIAPKVDLRWEMSYEAGLAALKQNDRDLCLLDFRLGAKTGLELLREAIRQGSRVPIVLLTGSAGAEVDRDAMRAGAADYLVKGQVTATQLDRTIRHARERAQYLDALRHSQQEFHSVIERLPACIMIRAGDTLVYANPATAAAMGYAHPEALIGKSFFAVLAPASHQIFRERIANAEAAGKAELTVFRADGTTMEIETAQEHVPITFEGAPAILTSIRDISEEKRARASLVQRAEHLQALSLTDELTELNNRRGFLAFSSQQLKMATRTKQAMVVLFIDLDGLKKINDEAGHEAGDAALRATAGVLRATFRDVDVLGRLGGDEFVALCVNCADPQTPLRRLAENVDKHNERHPGPFPLSLSTGASLFDPAAPLPIEAIVQAADQAMYEEKQRKRARRAQA